MPVLAETWRQGAGQLLPRQVRDHITRQHIDEGSQP